MLTFFLWNRVKTTFFTTSRWNSAGAITVNEMISFFLFWDIFAWLKMALWPTDLRFLGHFKTTSVCDRGLVPQNKAPSSPKLNYEALYIGGDFIKFQSVEPIWTNVKLPYQKLSDDASANNWAFFGLSRNCFNQSSEIWTLLRLVLFFISRIFLTLETAFFSIDNDFLEMLQKMPFSYFDE